MGQGVQPYKCQVVRVTTNRIVINTVYTLNGQILKAVTSARYLGGHLQWPILELPHIQNYWKCKSNFRIHPKKHKKNKQTEGERNSLQYACPPSAGVFCPLFGTLPPKIKHASWKKSKKGLHAGPPVIMIQGQVFQPCSTS